MVTSGRLSLRAGRVVCAVASCPLRSKLEHDPAWALAEAAALYLSTLLAAQYPKVADEDRAQRSPSSAEREALL